MTTPGGEPEGTGGRVGQPPADKDRGRDRDRDMVESAAEWGRAQAALAPRWSAAKRRRMAVLLGLVLPDGSDSGGQPPAPDAQPG